MAKPDAQEARRWISLSMAGTALTTLGTVWVGWASNVYDWHAPLMTFSVGVALVSWFGTIALVAVQCVKRFIVGALKYHRAKTVDDVLMALRRHEADQWARAAGMSKVGRAG